MRTGIYADLFVVPKIEKTTGKVPDLCTGRRIHAGGIPFTFRNPEAAEAVVENKKKERPTVSRTGLALWCTGSLFSGLLGTASRFFAPNGDCTEAERKNVAGSSTPQAENPVSQDSLSSKTENASRICTVPYRWELIENAAGKKSYSYT